MRSQNIYIFSHFSAEFSAEDSTLTISEDSEQYKNALIFLVSNSNAVIRLTNTKLDYGSSILLDVIGNNMMNHSIERRQNHDALRK